MELRVTDKTHQGFLTGEGAPLQGALINFHVGVSPYAPYNMETLINKFTNKYICFYSLFSQGA